MITNLNCGVIDRCALPDSSTRITYSDGAVHYKNSFTNFHCVDGPAIVTASGNQYWYLDGKPHRANGPAVQDANGDCEWYFHGKRHRADGPAIVRHDGLQEWYFHGKRHRTDGPAIVSPDPCYSHHLYWYHGLNS